MRAVWSLVLTACSAGGAAPTDTGDTAVGDSVGSGPTGALGDTAADGPLRIAIIADPHVIGDDYVCCESPGRDTESIYRTGQRFEHARGMLHDLERRPDHVFIVGDVMHQAYKSDRLEDYTDPDGVGAAQNAKQILDRFEMPVHLAWGNHDYEVPEFSRAFSHQVFEAVFDQPPYQAVEVGPWQVLLLNSQLGPTWDAMGAFLDTGTGSLGAEQLAWLVERLETGKPTLISVHHHPLAGTLAVDEPIEGAYDDLYDVVDAYSDVVEGMFFGHMHTWFDTSAIFGVPGWIMGATRYDADNHWVLELDADGSDYTILDEAKAVLGSQFSYGVDTSTDPWTILDGEDPEDDPAGPWPDGD